MAKCFEMVTAANARIMHLEHLGLSVGKRASLVVLDANDPVDALRLRAERIAVVSRGKLVAERPIRDTALNLPGRPKQASRRRPQY